MNTKNHNQESTAPNHYGLPVVQNTVKPAVRICDTGKYTFPLYEYDIASPPFNPIGAGMAVAVAAALPGSTLLVSPFKIQHQLHKALCRDMNLACATATLRELGSQQADRIVLDLNLPSSCPDMKSTLLALYGHEGFMQRVMDAAQQETMLLCDIDYLYNELPANAPLRDALDNLEQSGIEAEPFSDILLRPSPNPDEPGVGFHLDLDEAERLIHADVLAANNRVIWNLTEVTQGDDWFIMPRPCVEQILQQPLDPEVVVQRERQGFQVISACRGESVVFVDDDLVWIIGSPQFDDLVRPYVRVRGRQTTALLAKLYKLSEFFTPVSTL